MWKIIFSTFCLVFLAELGDKTQLATMLLATRSKSAVSVFIGSAFALVLSSLIGVIAGSSITKIIPSNYLQSGAGLAFIIIGILLFFGKI